MRGDVPQPSFPEDGRWSAERRAAEFGVEIGKYRSVVTVPRRVFRRLLSERPTPERCVEASISSEPGSRGLPSGSCTGAS